MSYNFLKDAKYISNSYLCRYDSIYAYTTDFSTDGYVNGWDIYHNIYMYGCWSGMLFGSSYSNECYISRSINFLPINAESYFYIDFMLYIERYDSFRTVKGLNKGKISWLRTDDSSWSAERSIVFDIKGVGEWYSYRLNLGPIKEWQGEINNLRFYPFIDGREKDRFFLKYIRIASDDSWVCKNTQCSYYQYYKHPCKGAGSNAYIKAGLAKTHYTTTSGINSLLKIDIDGYGLESFDLGDNINIRGKDLAIILGNLISSVDIGGYSFVRVIHDDDNKFKIISGTNNFGSYVKIPYSKAAEELGFYSNGEPVYTTFSGSLPASGFDYGSTRLLRTYELNKLIDNNTNEIAYLHDPLKYSVEAGRSDFNEIGNSKLVSDLSKELGYKKLSGKGSTILELSHRFNCNGKINFIWVYGIAYKGAKFKILRPINDGSFKVIYDIPIPDKEDGKLYTKLPVVSKANCDVLVNKGDVLAVYNVDIYVGTTLTNKPDATFCVYSGDISGHVLKSKIFSYGVGGLALYARGITRQSSTILDIDLGSRLNVSTFNIYGSELDKKIEFNIASCVDVSWEVDLFGESHNHSGYYLNNEYGWTDTHANIAYGIECLDDCVITADNGKVGDSYGFDNGLATYGDHSYFYVNGDAEWLYSYDCNQISEYCGNKAPTSTYNYVNDPIAFTLVFPNESEYMIHKSMIYFKEDNNFRNISLSVYKGKYYLFGNADDNRFELINNYNSINLNGIWYSKGDDSDIDAYMFNNPMTDDLYNFESQENNFALVSASLVKWFILGHQFDPIVCKGFRIFTSKHYSTKITEIELYSYLDSKPSLIDNITLLYSDYGNVWRNASFLKEGDNKVSSFIGGTPRYFRLYLESQSFFNINEIDIDITDQVFVKDDIVLLEGTKDNYISNSYELSIQNVYDDAYDLTVDIPNTSLSVNNVVYRSGLDSLKAIEEPDFGPKAILHKNDDFFITAFDGLCSTNAYTYGLINLIDTKNLYLCTNGVDTIYYDTLASGVSLGFSNSLYLNLTNCTYNIPDVSLNYLKFIPYGPDYMRCVAVVDSFLFYYNNTRIYPYKVSYNANDTDSISDFYYDDASNFGKNYILHDKFNDGNYDKWYVEYTNYISYETIEKDDCLMLTSYYFGGSVGSIGKYYAETGVNISGDFVICLDYSLYFQSSEYSDVAGNDTESYIDIVLYDNYGNEYIRVGLGTYNVIETGRNTQLFNRAFIYGSNIIKGDTYDSFYYTRGIFNIVEEQVYTMLLCRSGDYLSFYIDGKLNKLLTNQSESVLIDHITYEFNEPDGKLPDYNFFLPNSLPTKNDTFIISNNKLVYTRVGTNYSDSGSFISNFIIDKNNFDVSIKWSIDDFPDDCTIGFSVSTFKSRYFKIEYKGDTYGRHIISSNASNYNYPKEDYAKYKVSGFRLVGDSSSGQKFVAYIYNGSYWEEFNKFYVSDIAYRELNTSLYVSCGYYAKPFVLKIYDFIINNTNVDWADGFVNVGSEGISKVRLECGGNSYKSMYLHDIKVFDTVLYGPYNGIGFKFNNYAAINYIDITTLMSKLYTNFVYTSNDNINYTLLGAFNNSYYEYSDLRLIIDCNKRHSLSILRNYGPKYNKANLNLDNDNVYFSNHYIDNVDINNFNSSKLDCSLLRIDISYKNLIYLYYLGLYTDIRYTYCVDGGFNNDWLYLGKDLTSADSSVNVLLNSNIDNTTTYYNNYYPSNAIDGIHSVYNTINCWGYSDDEVPTFYAEFNEMYLVSKLVIYGGYDPSIETVYNKHYRFYLDNTISGTNYNLVWENSNLGPIDKLEVLFTPTNARRAKLEIIDFNGIDYTVTSDDGYDVIKNIGFIREIELYTHNKLGNLSSENFPVIALNLRDKFNIANHDLYTTPGRLSWSNEEEFFMYSDNVSDNPNNVEFNYKNSVVIEYFNDKSTGDLIGSWEYTYDTNIYLNSGFHKIDWQAYYPENVDEISIIIDGEETIIINAKIYGVGWVDQNSEFITNYGGYYNIIIRQNISNMYHWGCRYVKIYRNYGLTKWIAITRDTATNYSYNGDATISEPSFLDKVYIYGEDKYNLTEYYWWWNSTISKISYDSINTKIGSRSLVLNYGDNNIIDTLSINTISTFGTDKGWTYLDSLCFYLYINDVQNLDVSYGDITFGSINTSEGDFFYRWELNNLELKSGWNMVNLPFSSFDYVYPVNDTKWLDKRLDINNNDIEFNLLKLNYRGSGNGNLVIKLDTFFIHRNVFNLNVFDSKGLSLTQNDLLYIPISRADLSKGSVEFSVKLGVDSLGRDIFSNVHSATLFTLNNDNNDMISLRIKPSNWFEVIAGNIRNQALFNLKNIPESYYIPIMSSVNILLVWDSEGKYLSNKDTIRLYVNGELLMNSKTTWKTSSTKMVYFKLGGGITQTEKVYESKSAFVYSNLVIYDFCITDVGSYYAYKYDGAMYDLPEKFIEISKDDIHFYGLGSDELPFVFEQVPPGEKVPIYIRVNKTNGLKPDKDTAQLIINWLTTV